MGLKLLLVALFMHLNACFGQEIAHLMGDQAHFESEDEDVILWQFQPVSASEDTVIIWANTEGMNPPHEPPKYYVDEDDLHLEVRDLEFSNAGRYTASILPTPRSYDLLIVDEVECGNSGMRVALGDPLEYTCSVEYNSNDITPMLKWYDVGEVTDGVDNEHTEGTSFKTIQSTLTIANAAQEDDNKEYVCRVQFPNSVDLSANVTTHCTQMFRVEHAVSMIEFYRDRNHTERIQTELGDTPRLDEDSVIYAKVNGDPSPEVFWYCNGDLDTPEAEGFSMEIRGSLLRGGNDLNRCEVSASNNLNNGGPVTEVIEFFGIADDSGDDDNNDEASTSGAVIAAAVLVPLIVIIIVVVIVVYIVMKKRKARRAEANGTAGAAPEKTPYENKNFQGSEADIKNGPKSNGPPGYVPPSNRDINPNKTPYGDGPQNNSSYPGKPSPGYGDLGVKHLSGSVPGLNESIESLPDPGQRGGPPPISVDPRGPPMDHRAPPKDHRSGSPMDHRGPPMDHRGPTMDHRGPPMDHRGPPMDHRGPPMDHRGPPTDHQGPPRDHRGPPMDHRVPPVDTRGPQGNMYEPPLRYDNQGGDTQV